MISKVLLLGNRLLSIQVAKYLHEQQMELFVVLNPSDDGTDVQNNLSLKKWLEKTNIRCIQPDSLKDKAAFSQIKEFAPDFAISCSYQMIIPQNVIDIPSHGFINFHYANLPRNRGCLPVIWSLLDTPPHLATTIHEVVSALDAGAIVVQKEIPFKNTMTAEQGYQLCSEASITIFKEFWPSFCKTGNYHKVEQKEDIATYHKLYFPNDRWISWQNTAEDVAQFINALTFYPHPSARTFINNDIELGILGPCIVNYEISADAGKIVMHKDQLYIGCGTGAISFDALRNDQQLIPANNWHKFIGKKLNSPALEGTAL